jgi:hypothetical protein
LVQGKLGSYAGGIEGRNERDYVLSTTEDFQNPKLSMCPLIISISYNDSTIDECVASFISCFEKVA